MMFIEDLTFTNDTTIMSFLTKLKPIAIASLMFNKHRPENTSIIHKFAKVYHFKGPQDDTGKQFKNFISDSELIKNSYPTSKACQERCRWDFISSQKHPEWKVHGEEGDERQLSKTFVGFALFERCL